MHNQRASNEAFQTRPHLLVRVKREGESLPELPVTAIQTGRREKWWMRWVPSRRSLIVRLLTIPGALVGLITVIIFVMMAMFSPALAPYDPYRINLEETFEPPSLAHPFGTDNLGRDLLSRTIYGAQTSMTIGLLVVSIGLILGTVLGMLAGYYSGLIDDLIMRGTDIIMAFPSILLALLVISIIGPGLYESMIAIGVTYLPRFIRLAHSSVLGQKEIEYVLASRSIGQKDFKILFNHLLPNILGPLVVQGTLLLASTILIAASLGFIGLGVRPPTAEWGNMLSDGRTYLQTAPHVVVFPGLAIFLAVIGLNLLGDGLRDALDVRI